MHDTTAIKPLERVAPPPPFPPPHAGEGRVGPGKNANPRYAALYRHYPTIDYLRRGARRRLPHFAFEYCDGGSGKDDAGIKRNWAGLDAIEMVPRYGVMPSLPPCEVELFGRRYAAPIGVSPMGGPAIVWPGADEYLARAAQRAPHPLYARHGRLLDDRAHRRNRAGCVLVPALSRRQERSRHRLRSGEARARRRLPRADAHARRSGAHDASARSRGRPRRRLRSRSQEGNTDADVAGVDHGAAQKRHPAVLQPAQIRRRKHIDQRYDRVRAPRDGRRVHMGRGRAIPRPLEGHPDRQRHHASRRMPRKRCRSASTACSCRTTAGARSMRCRRRSTSCRRSSSKSASAPTVLYDSGIRSGTDVVRAYALGAAAAFAGKAFLWGLGALGEEGAEPRHRSSHRGNPGGFRPIGRANAEEARSVVIRHGGALHF